MARGGNGDHLVRRVVQLYAGLILYGIGISLQVEAKLGLDPWDVFHQGLAKQVGLSLGSVVIIVGALVLLLWIPLRQRPGIGTVSNVIVIGLVVDGALAILPTPRELAFRWLLLITGILAGGVATGLYIGARLGPGPRDGLMTGVVARAAARPGRPGFLRARLSSIRVVRTAIELIVLGTGWLLGGTVGIGTVLYAVCIGPLAHMFIPMFTVPQRQVTGPAARRQRVRP